QRDAFDERREDQRVRRDGTRDLGLARLRLGGAAADLSNADTGTNRSEAGADAGAHHRPCTGVLGVERPSRGLKKRKNRHVSSPSTNRKSSLLRAVSLVAMDAVRHRAPGLNGLLQALAWILAARVERH